MIIDFYNRNGGGGGTADLSGVVASAELSGTTLSLENNSGTTIDSVELSGLTEDYYTKNEINTTVSGITDSIGVLGTQVSANTQAIANLSGQTSDATELQPKTAIPESGAAGTLIALNKPDEYGWTSFIIGSGKSRTQISYYAEPGENPNPDLSLRPTRYEIDVRYADSVDENGNYTYNNSTNVVLSVDYQGNITFTNLGNFSQDGDVYSLVADIYDYATGENIQKTLYMSLENGYLYFNNGQGDCPYDMTYLQYQYYWQDMGYWDESDPENPVWQESWTEYSNYPSFQSWGIANPAKIGIYQANSANTFVEVSVKNADYAKKAGFTTLIKAYEDNGGDSHNDHFNAGDLIVPSSSDYRPRVKKGDGEGMDYDFESLAFQQEVLVLNNKVDNLKMYELTATGETPVYVDNGNLIAVHNSGETVVKQAYAEGGFTFIPYNNNAEGCYGVKTYTPNDYMQFCVGINNGIGEAMVWIFWQNGDWDLSGWNDWTITTTGTSWSATDGRGYEAEGYVDGDYAYVITNAPVTSVYGVNGVSDVRVPQTAYQTAVMSKQGVCQIWKGTQQEYDAIVTKSNDTIYVII